MMKLELSQQSNKLETKKKTMSMVIIEMIKLKYVIISLGVVLAGTAPFLHMLFPRYTQKQIILEEQVKNGDITYAEYRKVKKKWRKNYFGFYNVRDITARLGKPVSMLLFALIFLSSLVHINHKETRITLTISAILLLAISFYFIIWVFFPRGDLPKPAYYAALATGAIVSTVISYFFIAQNRVGIYLDNIRKLMRFIVVDVNDKYVNKKEEKSYTEDIIKVTNSLKK